ncbi:hypothetical protein ACFYT3_24925, partial [Nocardia amikacinitolerans]|uniref:hypothetical protein n=1 Tax=Nocardia amikacinitolerans TaxID=756689 RepID=UPI00367F1A5C
SSGYFFGAATNDSFRSYRTTVRALRESGGTSLDRELRYLRDVGYIDVRSIAQIPAEGDDLSDWVDVTPTGRDFIALRNEIT